MEPSDEPNDATARLEDALERIAQLAARRPAAPHASPSESGEGAAVVPQVAERLDALIARLRSALGNTSH